MAEKCKGNKVFRDGKCRPPLKECASGYERNTDTKRCRKLVVPKSAKVNKADVVNIARKVGLPKEISSKPLQKHQIDFVDNFINSELIHGALAIHGVGTGKTLTAVISAETFLQKYPDSSVIVITPVSLQAGFKQELYSYDEAIKNDNRYKFFTYDGYSNAYKKGEGNICKGALLIIDEAQNLRTHINVSTYERKDDVGDISIVENIRSGAKVLNILRGCALDARKVLLLSATPIVNSPIDLENLMAMINGHEPLDNNSETFKKVWQSPETLQRYFGCRISFFESNPANRYEFFPRMEEEFVPLVMSPHVYRKYIEVEGGNPDDDIREELHIDAGTEKINSFYSAVRRASNALDGIHSQKVDFMIDYIKHVLKKKPNEELGLTKNIINTHTDKFVIFTHFLDDGAKLITERLKNENIPFGQINGSVSKANREKIVKQYVDGKIKVILISKAGAEGLNLLETGYIFLVEPSWNNTEREQVKGRGVRFKSHTNLPENKRNVLILSLFLIKPEEANDFYKILDDDKKAIEETYKTKNILPSIDIRLFVHSNMKQKLITTALNQLKKTDPLEDCKQSKDFLDISNLFNAKRVNMLPPTPQWLKDFYNKVIINDTNVGLPEGEDEKYSFKKLYQRMIYTTRQLFGGQKNLVQLQNAFFTPTPIANDMIVMAGLKYAKSDVIFLEPTAGAGFITYAGIVSNPYVYCDAIEIFKPLQKLLSEFPRTRVIKDFAENENFFKFPTKYRYRVIIMNPPFHLKKGIGLEERETFDVDFVIKAYKHLREEGILVALISNGYEFKGRDPKKKREYDLYNEFRELIEGADIVKYEDGFSKKGGSVIEEMTTNVQLRLIRIHKRD